MGVIRRIVNRSIKGATEVHVIKTMAVIRAMRVIGVREIIRVMGTIRVKTY